VLTLPTVVQFFKILESASRYSHGVANKIFGESSLLRDLSVFLPHEASPTQHATQDEYPLVAEAINLLCSVFSEKNEVENDKKDEVGQARLDYELKKREYQLSADRRVGLATVAE